MLNKYEHIGFGLGATCLRVAGESGGVTASNKQNRRRATYTRVSGEWETHELAKRFAPKVISIIRIPTQMVLQVPRARFVQYRGVSTYPFSLYRPPRFHSQEIDHVLAKPIPEAPAWDQVSPAGRPSRPKKARLTGGRFRVYWLLPVGCEEDWAGCWLSCLVACS